MADQRQSHEDECKVDRISLFPDELLVSILGLLSFKEGAATSILSHRWRYLRTWSRKLDLDGNESLYEFLLGGKYYSDEGVRNYVEWMEKRLDEGRCSFIKWVDHIISQHKTPILEEFRLSFNLDRSNSPTIDKWLQFALSRKVEKLDLNLTDNGARSRQYDEDYIFPYSHYVDEFKFLKKLSTNHVNVSGEDVKGLLHNCPLLEFISLTQSNLTSLEIIKPFPSFKILEISMCTNLESLVIRDSNIVTLKVNIGTGVRHVVLKNVPLLTELWCWPDMNCVSMRGHHRIFSSVLPQLLLLKLIIVSDGLNQKDMRKFCSSVELSNLKQLVFAHKEGRHSCLRNLINFINASPRLERIVLEFPEYCENPRGTHPQTMKMGQSACGEIRKEYPHLKEMKIVGYHGLWCQFEVLMHFVKTSGALENIVVDTRHLSFESDSWWNYKQQTASSRKILDATRDELRKYVPPRINLHVI